MKFSNIIFLLASVFLFYMCDSVTTTNVESMDGNWLSVGYGTAAQIDGDDFSLSDLTSISCTPIVEGELSMFGDRLTLVNDSLRLEDGINIYYFTRIESAPDVCKQDLTEDKKNDPLYNFEVLSEIRSVQNDLKMDMASKP